MSMLKRILHTTVALCLAFSLAAQAAAFTPRIASVKKTEDGQYTVEGGIDGYDAAALGHLFAATYDGSGKMTGVGQATLGENGSWSFTGGKASGGTDSLKIFAVAGTGGGTAPLGENDGAVVVTSMEQLAAVLTDGACNNIFIAKDMTLSTEAAEKTIELNKTVTVSKGVTLTVPAGYTLQLNSGARLTVAGTLGIAQGALAAVTGSYTHPNGENTERIAAAELVVSGGTVNVAGTLRACPANTEVAANYDGGSGGIVTGTGSGGSVAVSATGIIEIYGGNTNETLGVYNNGGNMRVEGYAVTVGEGASLTNDNELVVAEGGVLTGAGDVINNFRLRLEGGSVTGTLNLDNRREIQAMDLYSGDGLTFTPAVIAGSVIYSDNGGNGWIYEAAQVTTGAGLLAALDEATGYGGENIEFSGGETLSVGGFAVPAGKSLRTFAPLNLNSGSTVNVYGTLETYNSFTIPADAALNVAQSGTLEVQGSGEQGLINAGSVAVAGILEVGVENENQGYLHNGGTGAITVTGDLEVIPGSTLENDGTVTGVVTLISDGENTGSLTGDHAGSTTSRTAIGVSSYEELISAMSNDAYDVLRVREGFEIATGLEVTKELVVPENKYLRITSGVTLTLGADAQVSGWIENQGTLSVVSGKTLTVRGRFYNNGGDPSGTLSVGGTVDINPGGLMNNHGGITIPEGGEVRIGGTLAWGSGDAMPVAGTGGYVTYSGGGIVSTSRTAGDWDEYNALLGDESCENIILGFDMAVTKDTIFEKGVTVPDGITLTVGSGVTLTVTNGAWLNLGGTLGNGGTVVVANEDGNQGHIAVNGGSVLDTEDGTIQVYGELRFNDYENTTINGGEHITYHYYASLRDLSERLCGSLGDGYGLSAPVETDFQAYASAYADWGDLTGDEQIYVAFVLKNMTDTGILEKTREGETGTYLEPYNRMSYGTAMAVLEQLWDAVKKDSTDLPDTVKLVSWQNQPYICTYDYGDGSELDNLLGLFMQAIGNITVTDPTTFTVNGGSEEQYVSYRTYEKAVTVVWSSGSGYSTNNIHFTGCVFEKGVTLINSGDNYRVSFEDCALSEVTDKFCDVYVEPEYNSGNPVFNVTDGSREIVAELRGTTDGVSVGAENCAVHVESHVAGGTFTLNGVTYHGAASLGSGGYFAGKYQLDASEGGSTVSFHAGQYTERVDIPGSVDFREFHVWDNIQNNVTLVLNGVFSSGGEVNICDDHYGDHYGMAVTGTAGDSTGVNALTINLHGSVEISGLTAHHAELYADSESAVGFGAGALWISPVIVGDYDGAAVDVGEGNLPGAGCTIELYQTTWEDGVEQKAIPEDVWVEYNSGNNRTYVYGLPSTDDLELEVTYGGVTVCWPSMARKFDAATQADFAEALYGAYGSNASFQYNSGASGEYQVGNAADFVIGNGLMTEVTGNPVTMYQAVTALSEIADILGVTMNDYFTDNALARVDYQDGVSYGEPFEAELLELASALALGSGSSPYYTDNGEDGEELAVGFNGSGTIGGTVYDAKGNSQLSVLLEAFQAACGGGVYLGDSPDVRGATFAGPVPMTLGGSGWSNVGFINCTFSDTTVGSNDQALNLAADCRANIRFENCGFTGAASGFAVNLSTVTENTLNANNVNLSNIPDGTRISTENVAFYADCGASTGSFSVNGATITALNFSNYDGNGHAYENAFFAAGVWWDDYENSHAPTLGFSGGVAGVTVPGACATKFGAFNAGDDCPYDITLDIAAGWTPHCSTWLGLRSMSAHPLKVTGTITGGTDEDLLLIELVGTTDITGADFTGNHLILTGKWINMGGELGQSHTVGNKNISVINYGGDSGRHIGIGIGSETASLGSAVVSYYSLGAEEHVTIDGIEGISLTEDGKVCVGDLTGTEGAFASGYTLTLYEYQGAAWTEITDYTVDTVTDSSNYRLVPATRFAAPYKVLLSVTNAGTTFNVAWDLSGGENGEIDVSYESALASALENSDINKINIVGDITLSPIDEQATTYTFGKEVVIHEGVTLTVADSVTLEVNNGLTVNGTLSVAGAVHVYGWIDDCGDWDAHITTSGTGQVYTYADFQGFAIDLYNRYSADYGLLNDAGHDDYEDCYAADYFENSDAAVGITAINFLIENGVIDSGATGLNGWVKLPYSGAMELLGGLAGALGTSLSRTITGYGVDKWTVGANGDNLLCNNGGSGSSTYDALLDSFAAAVGAVDISEPVTYSFGLNNSRVSCYKNYAGDVTANCIDEESGFYLFSHCAFGEDLTVNCGGADTILLIGCTIAGNLTVKDDDGDTNVCFYGTTFSTPAASTVTVTEKTVGGAMDSARLNTTCKSVVLYQLPAGIHMLNDKVSAAVINRNETGRILINGVEVTGETYTVGDETYFVTAFTCWQEVAENVEIPVLVAAGSTAQIDATGDTTDGGDGFAKFRLYEAAEKGVYASDTILLPKAGSAVNIANSASAHFLVSFDNGTTVINPVVQGDSEDGYYITVPTGTSGITYQIDTGSGFGTATPVDGTILLGTEVDYDAVSMIITYTTSGENPTATTVGIDTLAYTAAP